MFKKFFCTVTILFILGGIGCSDKVRVTGKVTFPDGSPLTVGKVMFETDSFAASGDLQSDGSYTLGTLKANDGIPPGTYRVSVSGATVSGGTRDISTSVASASGGVTVASVPMTMYVPAIATKYSRGETSDIICDVKKSMTFDFKVEPPGQ